MSFPTTGILDDFNRADTGPPPSASWSSNGPNSSNTLKVVSNACFDSTTNGGCWGTQLGPDSEVYTTLSTIMGNLDKIDLWIRAQQIGASTVDGYRCRFNRIDSRPGGTMTMQRIDDNVATTLGATIDDTSGVWANGLKVGQDMVGSTFTSYLNKGSWSTLGSRTDATYTTSGFVGMVVDDAIGVCDDFGGGTIASGPAPSPLWSPHRMPLGV